MLGMASEMLDGHFVLQVIAAGCPINTYNGMDGIGATPLVLAVDHCQSKVSRVDYTHRPQQLVDAMITV